MPALLADIVEEVPSAYVQMHSVQVVAVDEGFGVVDVTGHLHLHLFHFHEGVGLGDGHPPCLLVQRTIQVLLQVCLFQVERLSWLERGLVEDVQCILSQRSVSATMRERGLNNVFIYIQECERYLIPQFSWLEHLHALVQCEKRPSYKKLVMSARLHVLICVQAFRKKQKIYTMSQSVALIA